jgi:hypothetical protein
MDGCYPAPLGHNYMDDKTLARIYEHLDEDRVEGAVMGCLRLARTVKDYLNAAISLRELYPSKNEVVRALLRRHLPSQQGGAKILI